MTVFFLEDNKHLVLFAVLLFHCISYEGPHRVFEHRAYWCVSGLCGSAPNTVSSSLKTAFNFIRPFQRVLGYFLQSRYCIICFVEDNLPAWFEGL